MIGADEDEVMDYGHGKDLGLFCAADHNCHHKVIHEQAEWDLKYLAAPITSSAWILTLAKTVARGPPAGGDVAVTTGGGVTGVVIHAVHFQ